MALQVRLIHALGDRLIEVQPRTAEQPLVVGRSGEADVQLPSVNVSRKHCFLFVKNGQWILQDAGGGRGTKVNGKAIKAPVVLAAGDVVTLGSDPNPPQLVMDPYGVELGKGPTGSASEAATEGEAPKPDQPPRVPQRPRPGQGLPQPDWSPGSKPRTSGLPQPQATSQPPSSQPQATSLPQPKTGPLPQPPSTALPQPTVERYATPLPDSEEEDDDSSPPQVVWAAPAESEPEPGAEDGLEMLGNVSGTGRPRITPVSYYVPKQRGMSGTMIGVTILLTIAVLGGGAWFYVHRQNQVTTTEVVVGGDQDSQAVANKPKPTVEDHGIFNDPRLYSKTPQTQPSLSAQENASKMEPPAAPPVQVNNAPAPGDTAPTGDSTPPEPSADARVKDADFRSIEDTHTTATDTPEIQIARYADYLDQHPRSPFVADVKSFIDEALDIVWWKKIDLLIKQRDEQRQGIGKLNSDIAVEHTDYKKTLQDQKTELSNKLLLVEEQLKEMNYLSDERPNIMDSDQLKTLRGARDVQAFALWKKTEYLKIKRTRGGQW